MDRNQREGRIQPGSLGKGDLKHKKLKKINEKAEKYHTKEQTRNKEVQINEEEIGKLPEKEFRIMIVKMIKNYKNKMEKMQESINIDLEELKNKHAETNNTITEIKNTLEGVSIRISKAEERISELEAKMVELTSLEQNKVKRMKRTEDSLRDLWDHIRCTNIRIIEVPEEEEKKKGYENF